VLPDVASILRDSFTNGVLGLAGLVTSAIGSSAPATCPPTGSSTST
jgi:hypothetical protein